MLGYLKMFHSCWLTGRWSGIVLCNGQGREGLILRIGEGVSDVIRSEIMVSNQNGRKRTVDYTSMSYVREDKPKK